MRRGYTTSATKFGQESGAIQESVPALPCLLELWWAGSGNQYFPVPDNMIFPPEEVPALVDLPGVGQVLAPLRTVRLNRYVLQYMKMNNFHQSAAAFFVEANVTEIPGDCDGLLSCFWIPLCHITRKANVISASNQEIQDQPLLRLGDANMGCSSTAPSGFVQHDDPSVLDDPDFTLKEIMTVYRPCLLYKAHACHFSSDGRLLVYAGSNGKVSLWNIETRSHLATTPEHFSIHTDVRFKPHSTNFVASCSDSIIRRWDANDVTRDCDELEGHSGLVMTLDFCPTDSKILCSGDTFGELRFWDMERCVTIHKFKDDGISIKQIRFHPHNNLVAVASGIKIMILLFQTKEDGREIEVIHKGNLEGHVEKVKSVCWDRTSGYLASVSRESARVWMSTNNIWKCCYELKSESSKFRSCVFHSTHPQLLIIGAKKQIHIWDYVRGSKTRVIEMASNGRILSVACCSKSGFIASTSRLGEVKLWK